jgi:PKD repeat protein
MKTTRIQLNSALKLNWFFMLAALISFGFKTNAQCAASYSYSVNPANNGAVAFTNTSSGGSGLYYEWTFGDGGNSYSSSPAYTYAMSGTYTACLYIYDSLISCSDTVCNTFSVVNSGSPGCSALFTPFDSVGYGYFMNQSTGTGLTCTWSFGDGTFGTGTGDMSHLYPSPGIYYVCLSISNFMGTCTDSYCDSIRIGAGTSGMCMGAVNSYFTAYDTLGITMFNNHPSGTGPVYHWDFGDGATSSAIGSTMHAYTAPGTYMVCLTVYETGGTYDSCQYCSYVTTGTAPAGPCDASFAIIQDSTNMFNYYVYNNASGSSPAMSYLWDFGDGTSSTLQYPSHTYLSSGPYYLCLTVTDSSPMLSCTNTFCDSLAAGHASAPVTVTVVNTATGINEAAVYTSLENYPNPFSGSTTVSYSISTDAVVELIVTDLLGNTVARIENSRRSAGAYSAVWNAENVAAGMYLLRMNVNDQGTTKKIILNK